MALSPRLDLRQSQSLVMTPQLQQAIKLLTLSNLEIESFIAGELERNPLLGTEEQGRSAAPGADGDGGADGEGEGDGWGEVWGDRDAPGDPVTADRLIAHGDGLADTPLDVDLVAETFHHDGPADAAPDHGGAGVAGDNSGDRTGGGTQDWEPSLGGGSDGGSAASADGPDFDSFAAPAASLGDHLLAQAGQCLSGPDLAIATHLIDLIDEAGYLRAALLDVAQRLGVPLATVERVLGVIHGFDPTGVGARSLAECLALQAREADRYDPAMARMIDNLDLLAAGKLAQLRRICGVDEEDLADMIRELRGYDPKPGLRFDGARVEAVSPDLFVTRRGDGWAIEINGATLPRLLVDRHYYAELCAGANKASRAWLGEQLQTANWLVKALDQRQRTIIKVATEIVRRQEGFFQKGVAHLRPLTLRQVAEAVGLHESTVSRVTSNKYLSCARGLFELKYFFTSAIQAADGGEAVSAEAVKTAIRTLIAAEQPDAILSDDTLVDMLRERGFDIARRTVAKYREAMGIGSSVQRRRQKALGMRAA
ncbi:RNA polymerase factor sigma-54 [Sphingomonas changnyeongensis]|uniref:RNA polymerase sigma-54 factor n=1 Tax=Sphingomonas changnyeongensis TaxID=2698679 RepID=A0A7Z2NUI9_9SPHN|nr:RNA polymerase factor sigma-54 [Sphingomonas changnyeongensis]QHL89962.1 RNA polymerase factor sigma-54 [Sphingomonas changnyeongensis]